ncbi:MAG: hypothetical protein ACPGOY_14575 [Rhodospirillaceae bacterium]
MPIEKERILALKSLFSKAEAAIHEAEGLHEDVIIPSINQLRYAGYHLLIALTDDEQIEVQMTKAENHCQRAVFDANDSILNYLLANIAQFRRDYRLIALGPHFPEYKEAFRIEREAQEFLKKAKQNQKSREKFYAESQDMVNKLIQAHNAMEESREELNKELKRHNRDVIIKYATFILLFLGSIITIMKLFN